MSSLAISTRVACSICFNTGRTSRLQGISDACRITASLVWGEPQPEPKSFMVRGYFRELCAATSPPGSYSGVTYERPRDGPSKWTLLLCCEISALKQSATLHLCRLAQHEGERPE